ncbi:MAG: nucleotidyltransferase substrate binding protein [Verrucomicrobiota bacterium]
MPAFHGSLSRERFLERQADALAIVSRLAEAVAQTESPLVRDAPIQRFEFTFEIVWKALKRYLECQGYECGGSTADLETGLYREPDQQS